jgi:hypothetical protein
MQGDAISAVDLLSAKLIAKMREKFGVRRHPDCVDQHTWLPLSTAASTVMLAEVSRN